MAISAKTSVLTANDWQYAKDIRPGDWVFNRFGQPVRVKTTQTFRSEECYRITFDDNLSLDGDQKLVLPTEDVKYRQRVSQYKGVYKFRTKLKPRSLEDMMETGLVYRGSRSIYSVPTTDHIQLPHQPLGIPPFVYGFWFFSRLYKKILRVPNEFSEETFQIFKDSGYQVEKLGQYQGKYEKFRTKPSIWEQLKGQQTHKIHPAYLNGSAEQRFELIKGIICTKPCRPVRKSGQFTIKIRKKHLYVSIQYLVESLGAKTKIYIDKTKNLYILSIDRNKPFVKEMASSKPSPHLARRYVKSIEQIPAQLCVHIETDDEDGSFLAGEGFIPCL